MTRPFRSSVWVLTGSLILALAAGCAGSTGDAGGGESPTTDSSPTAEGTEESEEPVEALRIGAILPQTGALAPIGAGLLRGTEAAVTWWNAQDGVRSVELTQCDDQSTAEAALACYRQLQESVDVIVGPHIFFQYAAIRELVAQDGPPLFTAVPFADAPAGSYIFQSQPHIIDIVTAELDYAAENELTRVATLTADDQPGNIGKEAAAELAEDHGVEIVTQEVFDPQAQNLAPQAQNIAEADPDVVISWVLGPALVTSLRALNDAGVTAPVLMASGSMSAPLLAQAGEQTPPELIFFASQAFEPDKITDTAWQERVQSFVELFQDEHDQQPDFNALAAADTVLFPASVADAERTGSPEELRDALQSSDGHPSFLWNTYTYTEDDHKGVSGSGYSALLWHLDTSSWTLVE